MSFLKSRFTAHSKGTEHRGSDDTYPAPSPDFNDMFYEGDTEMKYLEHSGKYRGRSASSHDDSTSVSSFRDGDEKKVFEDQLNLLQEQLVSAMIENQNLADELKQYRTMTECDKLRQELEAEKQKRKQLEHELKEKNKRLKRRELNKPEVSVLPRLQDENEEFEIVEGADVGESVIQPETLEEEKSSSAKPRKVDRLWDRIVEMIYDTFDDFTVEPRHDDQPEVIEPLNMKILKENIRRFKLATQPYFDTIKGLQNLFSWKSPSYTFIVFCVYMLSVWKGWFVPLLFFLGALRLFVNFLHSKDFQFKFAYFDPGEPSQDGDKDLGISDKFNLVIQVATKVQNGLGSAADSLEKIKNLLTWKHYEGCKKLFIMLCCGFIVSALLPASYMWKFMGLGLGVKIFITKYIYNKYPRLKKKYDSTHKLWLALPTDAQYKKQCHREEVHKYIVPNQRLSDGDCDSLLSESVNLDSSDEEEASNFRDLFSLPVEETPLQGWLSGKRTVLFGKERSLISLLSKKRGKLYLTKSFLCFVRDKTASKRNIVIPLQDIVNIQKVKPLHKLPGKGMAIQILVNHDGIENSLVFGGIIGRDDVVKGITAAMEVAKQGKPLPETGRTQRVISHRKSSESISRLQNFTFAAYYEDSE